MSLFLIQNFVQFRFLNLSFVMKHVRIVLCFAETDRNFMMMCLIMWYFFTNIVGCPLWKSIFIAGLCNFPKIRGRYFILTSQNHIWCFDHVDFFKANRVIIESTVNKQFFVSYSCILSQLVGLNLIIIVIVSNFTCTQTPSFRCHWPSVRIPLKRASRKSHFWWLDVRPCWFLHGLAHRT